MVTLYPTIKMACKAEILPPIKSTRFLTILVGILHFTRMRYAEKKADSLSFYFFLLTKNLLSRRL